MTFLLVWWDGWPWSLIVARHGRYRAYMLSRGRTMRPAPPVWHLGWDRGRFVWHRLG